MAYSIGYEAWGFWLLSSLELLSRCWLKSSQARRRISYGGFVEFVGLDVAHQCVSSQCCSFSAGLETSPVKIIWKRDWAWALVVSDRYSLRSQLRPEPNLDLRIPEPQIMYSLRLGCETNWSPPILVTLLQIGTCHAIGCVPNCVQFRSDFWVQGPSSCYFGSGTPRAFGWEANWQQYINVLAGRSEVNF